MSLAKNIADRLLQINAIKLNAPNPFTWASGLRSPIYCDNRLILSYPAARKELILALVRESSCFDGINAIAYLADRLDLPYCYVRNKPKEHGMKNLIEGKLPENSTVLVIEDLISTGGSSLEAVHALQENEIKVAGVLAIFQYGFLSANEKFKENKFLEH